MEEPSLIGLDLASGINKSKGITGTDPLSFIRGFFVWLGYLVVSFFILFLSVLIFFQRGYKFIKRELIYYISFGRVKGIYNLGRIVIISLILFFLSSGIVGKVLLVNSNASNYTDNLSLIGRKDLMVESISMESINQEYNYRVDVEYYVVRSDNETINSIAQKYNISADTIKWANKLSNDSDIKKGQKLKIPPGNGILYTVKKGDDIDAIASKYGVSTQTIMEVNWLDTKADLPIGEEIFIPDGKMPVKTASRARGTIIFRSNSEYKPQNWQAPGSGKFLTWPVTGTGRSQVAGYARPGHVAIDIINSPYTKKTYDGHPPVVAAAPGQVVFSGYKCNGYRCGFAWHVALDHKNGYSTVYAHLQPGTLKVKVGEYVERGQELARMGESGWAYGVHLHFELRKGVYSKEATTNYDPLSAMN